jgi:hypothetical protein
VPIRLIRKTDIHMPSGIPWVIRAWKSHGKLAQIRALLPAAFSNELVERLMQHRSICGKPEGLLVIVTEPHYRVYPGSRIVGIETGVAPKNGTAFVCKFPRECIIDPYEPTSYKVL